MRTWMRLKLDLKLVFRKLSLFEAEREDISLDILMSRHRFFSSTELCHKINFYWKL